MSVVQICNRGASQYLGLGRVNSLDEQTPQSEQYQLHYDDLRKALLEKHWWIFAKTVQALAQVENDRPNDWSYKYQLPSRYRTIHWINDLSAGHALVREGKNPDAIRETIGSHVYCNVPKAYVQYTADEDNTALFPQYFRDALSAMVASAIAVPLTESVQRARFASDRAEFLIEEAIVKDMENLPPLEAPQATYIDARMGGSYTGNSRQNWSNR